MERDLHPLPHCNARKRFVDIKVGAQSNTKGGGMMLSNRELTQREFSTSNYVKIAIHCLMEENYPGTKEYLLAALEVIHRE